MHVHAHPFRAFQHLIVYQYLGTCAQGKVAIGVVKGDAVIGKPRKVRSDGRAAIHRKHLGFELVCLNEHLYLRRDLVDIVNGWLRQWSSQGRSEESHLGWLLITATIPAVLAGLHETRDHYCAGNGAQQVSSNGKDQIFHVGRC